jgi:hypothetical protein
MLTTPTDTGSSGYAPSSVPMRINGARDAIAEARHMMDRPRPDYSGVLHAQPSRYQTVFRQRRW